MKIQGLRALRRACIEQFPNKRFPDEIMNIASSLRTAASRGSQIPLLSDSIPDFDQTKAYQISGATCGLNIRSGLRPVGRKIGFTNQKIWSEYNVSEPNWGYLWDQRCQTEMRGVYLVPATMNLQPRLEPEIVFGLKARPHSYMSEKEALSCIEWMAHGYEIVISLFKGWKFTAADTTAVNALHNRLYIGKRLNIDHKNADTLVSQLENFHIKLYNGRTLVDTGSGSNVLGSPIKALLHICRMLESQIVHPGLCAGEIITTGTLTKAVPVSYGEVWSTVLKGIDLPGLKLPIIKLDNRKEANSEG